MKVIVNTNVILEDGILWDSVVAVEKDQIVFVGSKDDLAISDDADIIDAKGLYTAFSTSDPNAFYYTQDWDKEQAWCRIDIGFKPMIKTITGGIFEFGFTDAILQMWATFIKEIQGETPYFGCFTPEETELSHKLLTAALKSHKEKRVVDLDEIK